MLKKYMPKRLVDIVSLVLTVALVVPSAAFAQAGSCAAIGATSAINVGCPQCIDGACTGLQRVIDPYPVCNYAAASGKQSCVYGTTMINVGSETNCIADVSYWGITYCMGAGCITGLAGCMLASVPCLAGAGVAYFGCLAACCGGASALAFIACCSANCYCVDSCGPGSTTTPFLVPQPSLQGDNCPRS